MPYDRDSHERPPLPGAGFCENYTNAFLVSFGALVFMALFVLWVVFGLPVTVVLALLADRLLLNR